MAGFGTAWKESPTHAVYEKPLTAKQRERKEARDAFHAAHPIPEDKPCVLCHIGRADMYGHCAECDFITGYLKERPA